MRLAVDARTIFRPNRRGIGNSLLALYRQLMVQHPDWQVIAYHRDPNADPQLLPGATLRCIETRGDRFDLWQQWRLPFAAWRDNADVLHCPANEAPRWTPVPTVVTVHDLIPLKSPAGSRPFERGVRRACRRASAILCPSNYTRDRLLAQFSPPAQRLHVVPWGAPHQTRLTRAQRASILSHYGITAPFALHFGAPDPRKNTLPLIDAWAQAQQHLQVPWQLVIIGLSPADLQSVMARAQSRDVASSVLPLSFLNEADVPPLLACADFLAYPSSAEGFGLPILEAWAAGTAVLAGSSTSLPEIAGSAALLVDPRNQESLVDGLTSLMRDADLRHRLAFAGRQRVRQFTWRKAASAFARILQDVAGVPAAPAIRRSRPSAASISIQTAPSAPVDVLVVSLNPLWPMDQGYRVHGPHMARALQDSGLRVAVSCLQSAPKPPALLRDLLAAWPAATPQDTQAFAQTAWQGIAGRLRHRLTRHLGPEVAQLAGILPLVRHYRPRAVLGVGMLAPLLLQGISSESSAKRLWHAADELVYFNASCLKSESLWKFPSRLRSLLLHGLYERAFAGCLDGAIAASPLDQKLLRQIAGISNVALIRNGVNLASFAPSAVQPTPRTIVFWGRLDFEPNVDALCWFAENVWPRLCGYRSDVRWQIIGKNPCRRVQTLRQLPGVELLGAVRDIRPYARRAAAVILPMRCGGGIKNKLLEAAALGRPIIASPHAVRGLEMDKLRRPVLIARTAEEFATAVRRLWADSTAASQLARRARAWVQAHHSWSRAACEFCRWLDLNPAKQPAPAVLAGAQRIAA